MKNRRPLLVFLAVLAVTFITCCFVLGCTENQRARQFGGTGHVEVKPGHKVVGATWKNTDLWVLTRPMRPGEEPETLSLREFSSWGAIEGEMLLREVDSQETAREAGR